MFLVYLVEKNAYLQQTEAPHGSLYKLSTSVTVSKKLDCKSRNKTEVIFIHNNLLYVNFKHD